MRRARTIIGGIVAAAILAAAGAAVGQTDAAKVIEQRQALMKAIGGNVKALSAILKGEAQEPPEQVKKRAMELSEASQKIAMVFKPEYHIGNVDAGIKTEALPDIWQQSDKFSGAAADLDAASKKLAAASDTGEDAKIKAAIADLTKTCGGCHNVFRQKKS